MAYRALHSTPLPTIPFVATGTAMKFSAQLSIVSPLGWIERPASIYHHLSPGNSKAPDGENAGCWEEGRNEINHNGTPTYFPFCANEKPLAFDRGQSFWKPGLFVAFVQTSLLFYLRGNIHCWEPEVKENVGGIELPISRSWAKYPTASTPTCAMRPSPLERLGLAPKPFSLLHNNWQEYPTLPSTPSPPPVCLKFGDILAEVRPG